MSRPGLISGPLKPKPKLILTQFQGLTLLTPSLVLYFILKASLYIPPRTFLGRPMLFLSCPRTFLDLIWLKLRIMVVVVGVETEFMDYSLGLVFVA